MRGICGVLALAIMARLVVCALALLVASGLADPAKKVLPQKNADQVFLQRQIQISELFYHIHEPVFIPEQRTIVESWDIEKNIEHFHNITAVKIWGQLWDHGILPRCVPFSILCHEHRFEAVTVFNVLYSAKDYETFYRTAVWFRHHINEHLFVYVLTAAIIHRHDTQGFIVPPVYEIFPSHFLNGEIMTTAQRLNVQGEHINQHMIEHYPGVFMWNENLVIRWNDTMWPYYAVQDNSVAYFTHDHELNTYYYNQHLTYPLWLGGEVLSLSKDRRGEWFWFVHKQILTRYYMERLSNGLGEIPELGLDVVQDGYWSGLIHHNGIPYPSRPNHFHLDQHHLIDELTWIHDYERRVREAIDLGYVINTNGERVPINHPEAIDILGNIIEVNVDSPNVNYYRDFVSLWKAVLGNNVINGHGHVEWNWHESHMPLVLPSVLEQFQTSLRDPAFYMIWKRVLGLFTYWQRSLPLYRPEELAHPSVHIHNVEVDKLVTYFENTYMNVTNHLYLNEFESKAVVDQVSVLVQRPQLNHKVFQVRVNVKSDAAQAVVVRFFLAPKHNSHGFEIPLHHNFENMFLLDQFTHDLPAGDSVIKRDSTENVYTITDWPSHWSVYEQVENALHGKSHFVIDQSHRFNGYPQRLVLPKGRVSGMPFVLVVYISEYHAPRVPYGTGFDPALSLGVGTGAVRMTDDPIGFPFNRPVWDWQIRDLHNIWLEDVHIYHKLTHTVDVPYTEH